MRNIVLSDNPVSAKRFVTLMMAMFLMLASFLLLVVYPVTIFFATKGHVEKIQIITPIFDSILEKAFYIVLAGLGFISTVDVAAILKSKAKDISTDRRNWYRNIGNRYFKDEEEEEEERIEDEDEEAVKIEKPDDN